MKKRTILRIIGAVLLVAALVVAQVPVQQTVAQTASSSDFDMNGDILVKYTGTAQTVSVPDTVKVIGEEAFANNSTIYTVTLPTSVKKISYAAFSGCNNLNKIVIPDSVEEIGTAAFCNCSSLTDVKIGKKVEKFGSGVFTGCSKLENVDISKDNSYITCDKGVIFNKKMTKLYQYLPGKKDKAYAMPDSVERVTEYAFYGCTNLNDITLSAKINDITAYSFSNCIGLKNVYIPYSVNAIDTRAFENCVNITDISIPISVTSIHKTAFEGCTKLNIIAPEGSYAADYFKNMDRSNAAITDQEDKTNVIQDDVSQNQNPVSGNNTVSASNPQNSVEPEPIEGLLGESVVVGRKAVIFINNTQQTVISGVNTLEETDPYHELLTMMDQVLQTETYGKGLTLPKFAVIGNSIAGRAFYGDIYLTEYEIAEDITAIGDFAFARSNIESIVIPDTVTHIGYGAFYHCDQLSSILIPATVTSIEPAAFSNTRMMDNWMKYGTGDYYVCGDGILIAYRGADSKITIPEGIKQIGPEAFKDHKGITDLFLPDSLEKICEDAFSGCINLKNVSGGMNVRIIEDRAFAGCPLNTIRIVDSVQTLGLGAFDVSECGIEDSKKAVYFAGTTIPNVTYEKTATRLSNDSYRKDSLSGVKVAVIGSNEINLQGTVLDSKENGFAGLICRIVEDNNEYFNGTLEIIGCTLSAAEAENFTVPSTMLIYDKGYNFIEEDLNKVLADAKSGKYENEEQKVESNIEISGVSNDYQLIVNRDDSRNTDIEDAYKRIYGDSIPSNFTTYDIQLISKENIPISKLGKQKMGIVIELPNNMPTTNLHVICIDENCQLEDLAYTVVDNEGKLSVSFEASHTGSYGLYAFKSTAIPGIDLDESPDTGDIIHPKWMLCVGLICAAIVLFLISNRNKYKIMNHT